MENLDIKLLLTIENILKNNAEQGLYNPQQILSIIKEKGFYSCIYYDAVNNVSTSDYQLFISFLCGTIKQKEFIGKSVDYQDTAISRAIDIKSYIIQEPNDNQQTEYLKQHTDLLSITDKYRIHIPIYYNDMLIGALSCSWEGSISLDDDQIYFFRMIGTMMSAYWKIANDNLAANLIKKLKDSIEIKTGRTKVDIVLSNAMNLIKKALNVNTIALFEYNWYSNTLKKIDDSTRRSHDEFLTEEYKSGQFLTGKAWDDDKYKHIVDFNQFMNKYESDINELSYIFHKKKLSTIKTILYNAFGTKANYFLRLMNRSDNDIFPFSASHKVILNLISEKLTELIDQIVNNNKISNLEEISKSAITNIASFDKTLGAINKSLSYEGICDLGMLAYEEGTEHFKYKYFSDNSLKNNISKYCSWEESNFYQDCVETKVIKVIKTSTYKQEQKTNTLLNGLVNLDISFILIIPFVSIRIKGFFIIVPPSGTSKQDTNILTRIPLFHKNTLLTYAGLIGGCIESADSHLTSENARRLIGHIGHEIQGPISDLGQTAIYTGYNAIDKIKEIQTENQTSYDNIINSLKKNIKEAKDQMKQINVFMDVAVDMALQTKGSITTTFKAFDLSETLKEAVKEAEKDVYRDKNDVVRKVKFEFNHSIKSMSCYVGDRYLIKKVFVNIFRNAIKYSMPPSGNIKDPIKIEVFGNPQINMYNIQIINWGNPLENDKLDIIFNAFERGDSKDKHKARRGMGLGLYIARTFLSVHGGRVFCKESYPTLHDERRKYIEGWRTTFEIRLPYGLKEGVFDASI